jgi:hypothetical protein
MACSASGCRRHFQATKTEESPMIRETIIRKIVELELAGHSLLEDNVRSIDELLHVAAVNEFGSWETALQYAGVNAHDVGRCRDLTPERIKQQLRRLCTTGYDLGAKVNRSRDRAHYEAAVRHFGSWREALTAAGINLANVTRHRPKNLDRDAMLLWIRNRKEAGQSFTFSEVCLENRDYALAIKREFGSWARALEAAFPTSDEGL